MLSWSWRFWWLLARFLEGSDPQTWLYITISWEIRKTQWPPAAFTGVSCLRPSKIGCNSYTQWCALSAMTLCLCLWSPFCELPHRTFCKGMNICALLISHRNRGQAPGLPARQCSLCFRYTFSQAWAGALFSESSQSETQPKSTLSICPWNLSSTQIRTMTWPSAIFSLYYFFLSVTVQLHLDDESPFGKILLSVGSTPWHTKRVAKCYRLNICSPKVHMLKLIPLMCWYLEMEPLGGD